MNGIFTIKKPLKKVFIFPKINTLISLFISKSSADIHVPHIKRANHSTERKKYYKNNTNCTKSLKLTIQNKIKKNWVNRQFALTKKIQKKIHVAIIYQFLFSFYVKVEPNLLKILKRFLVVHFSTHDLKTAKNCLSKQNIFIKVC